MNKLLKPIVPFLMVIIIALLAIFALRLNIPAIFFDPHNPPQEQRIVRKLDVNGDGVTDSFTIIILPDDTGRAFRFDNQAIPDLVSNGSCLKPEYLFNVADLDEDGATEVGLFINGCASRWKGLGVYTLKNKQWIKIGQATYDSFAPTPHYTQRVRKTAKGQFEILEILNTPFGTEIKAIDFVMDISE